MQMAITQHIMWPCVRFQIFYSCLIAGYLYKAQCVKAIPAYSHPLPTVKFILGF